MIMILIIKLLFDLYFSFATSFPDLNEPSLVQGKIQYNMMVTESKIPRYGPCWKKALELLDEQCDHLTDETQSRLALSFTNCFLEKAGKKTYPCSADADLSHCLQKLETVAFNAYTNFFTHTQNLCYFLKSQVWHQETRDTIEDLSDTSRRVSTNLAESMRVQDQIAAAQEQTLINEAQLLRQGVDLGNLFEAYRGNVQELFLEFKESTSEQKVFINEIFDQVAKLHSFIFGEMAGFFSVMFYVVALIVCYLLTATPRTGGARFYIFVLLSVNVVVERLVTKYGLEEMLALSSEEAKMIQFRRIWFCRKVFCTASVVVLTICSLRFKDIMFINNEKLEAIYQQNSELKSFLQSLSTHSSPASLHKIEDKIQAIFKTENGFNSSDSQDETVIFSESQLLCSSSDESFNLSTDNLMMKPRSTWSYLQKKIHRLKKKRNINRNFETVPQEATRSRYNLRSRSNKPITVNPIVEEETPEMFAQVVKHLENVTKRNTSKIKRMIRSQQNNMQQFSSDEN